MLRINLSHTPLDKLGEVISLIQSSTSLPICLDTEGAQVRTGPMDANVTVGEQQRIIISSDVVSGTANRLAVTPSSVIDNLELNSLIGLDFDGVVLLVLKRIEQGVETVVVNGGKIGSNKAVVIEPAPLLPPLSEKDRAAIQLGLQHGIRHFALSFANSAADVELLRSLVGSEATIIAKIESKRGIENIDDILRHADEILIDRGDLSREVPLENLPYLQKIIIRKANVAGVPVNVATNLLESMLTNRKPTRAEINDIVNTMLDGANGLVLAAETAIGAHPVQTVDTVLSLIERYRRSLDGYRVQDLLEGGAVLLPSLHGSSLAKPHGPVTARRVNHSVLSTFPAIEVDVDTAMDIEQLGTEVYSPLRGFMTKEELDSVLNDYRLPNGQVWTMPIILQGRSQEFAAFHPGQLVRLVDQRSGETIAILHLEDKYEINLNEVAQKWFGTTDPKHPGVKRFASRGVSVLGGPIEYLKQSRATQLPYQLTPAHTRALFDIKGWSRVVAFHTRNVPHRGHEHVIANALERCNGDGLLIHPVVGAKKAGDFTAEAIIGAYERLISTRLPNALLAVFSTYSRYCGPREAVFTALCRKNFGCTHFLLGRDHTGVGTFYSADQNRRLFESLGDIGIVPVFFDAVYFSPDTNLTVEANGQGTDKLREISGTMIRDLFAQDQPIPEWCMRSDIVSHLTSMRQAGQNVFVE